MSDSSRKMRTRGVESGLIAISIVAIIFDISNIGSFIPAIESIAMFLISATSVHYRHRIGWYAIITACMITIIVHFYYGSEDEMKLILAAVFFAILIAFTNKDIREIYRVYL